MTEIAKLASTSKRAKPLPLHLSSALRLNDAAIRASLRATLRNRLTPNEHLMEELGLREHAARADVAVLGAELHGYEIKGETDSLARLSRQLDVYQQVFDRVTVVAASSLAFTAEGETPEWCGIISARRAEGFGVVLQEIRPATRHSHVDPTAVAELLWRNEALELLERLGPGANFKRQPRAVIWQKLADTLSLTELRAHVVSCLANRSAWSPASRRG